MAGAPSKHGLRDIFAALGRPKVAAMLALGFSSGLPFLLTGATFGYWLADESVDIKAIGFLSWVGLAYTFKVFWAPLMDRARAPIFGALGWRRGWAIFAQSLVALGLVLMSVFGAHGPGGLATIGAFALLVAFASATQDIAVDAWRIESAPDAEELGLITSAFQLGYRIALLVTDAVILVIAQFLGWNFSYDVMAVLMAVGICAAWLTPDPPRVEAPKAAASMADNVSASSVPRPRLNAAGVLFLVTALWVYLVFPAQSAPGLPFGSFLTSAFALCAILSLAGQAWLATRLGAISTFALIASVFAPAIAPGITVPGPDVVMWPALAGGIASGLVSPPRIYDAIVGPFVEFIRAHAAFALVMLLMISLYRLPEFVIGPVAGPFYSELGMNKAVVGGVRASVGMLASMAGIAAGGFAVLRMNLMHALVVGAVLQGLGVAAYALVAFHGLDMTLFSFAMASDNFCYAFAGVALVTYMSKLTSLGYTATQYALLSSAYTLFGKFLKGFSGVIVADFEKTHTKLEAFGMFYLCAGAIALPALALCIYLAIRQRAPAESKAA